jgi:hypothetical protein
MITKLGTWLQMYNHQNLSVVWKYLFLPKCTFEILAIDSTQEFILELLTSISLINLTWKENCQLI